MNDEHFKMLLGLSPSEIRNFFILYVGLDCFVKEVELIKYSKSSFLEEMKRYSLNEKVLLEPYSFRLKITHKNYSYYLLFRNRDKTFCKFAEEGPRVFKRLLEYDDVLDDSIIELLIDACHNNVSRGEDYKNLHALFELKKTNLFGYRFIVGSGINYGYNMPLWSDLKLSFETEIDSIFGKPICNDINNAVFNTSYGSFQIVKDISYRQYEFILKSMIDSSINPSRSDNTTLTAVAAVLYAQSKKYSDETQYVLTFNYDDLLEKTVRNCFLEDAATIFKNPPPTVSINQHIRVIHSHGYIPKAPDKVLKKHYASVVLTTSEYFENYKNPKSYGYSQLYNHLDRICFFVGNGLTDYEEQKVVSKHFNDHPSQFHFFYGSLRDAPIEAVMYKTIFLLKIGVIPLWYTSHDDYKAELYDYAEKLINQKLR